MTFSLFEFHNLPSISYRVNLFVSVYKNRVPRINVFYAKTHKNYIKILYGNGSSVDKFLRTQIMIDYGDLVE